MLNRSFNVQDGPNHFLGANELPSSQLSSSQSTAGSDAATDVPTITMSQMPSDLSGLSSSASPYEDERKQNVPFRNIPPPTKYEAPSPVQYGPPSPTKYGPPSPIAAPVRKAGTVDQASYGARQDTSSDVRPDTETKKEAQGDYSDVASAAQAAAELANRAVAAARAAADLAKKRSGDYSSRVPEKITRQDSPPEDEESATDLDSDDEEERPAPVQTTALRGRYVQEPKKPAPAKFSDSDSETAEYDVPRGRGAGGTKARSKSAYEAPEPYGKQKPPLKATKLDFQTADTSSKPAFDSDDDDDAGEGSVLFRPGKQERDNPSPRGNSRSGSKGGGLKWISRDDPEKYVSGDDPERYVSRDESERYDIFDANRDKTTLRYSAFDSGDHNSYGKNDAEYETSRPEETYASYDQPFAAKQYTSKFGSRSREGSPLFDEEGSVGRAREPSRLGSLPRTSHFDDEDEHDASLFSGTQKYGSDDYSSYRDPSPKTVDEDDLAARFEALKLPRRR